MGLLHAVESIVLFVAPQNTLRGPDLTSLVLYGAWFSCTQETLDLHTSSSGRRYG